MWWVSAENKVCQLLEHPCSFKWKCGSNNAIWNCEFVMEYFKVVSARHVNSFCHQDLLIVTIIYMKMKCIVE